ncbi:MAG: conjugative transposon protein TraM, partial [Bacteroidales bacterium]|nr:conjugative transposon protein TraM [Bacteroidales bacterium]
MSKNANDLKKKEQVKKWLVYSAMVIACAVFVWFIFKPSKKQLQTEQQNTGLNTQLPAPRNAGIEADKITAYELDDMRVRQEQKMMTLEDFAAKISDEGQERNIEISEINGTLHKADGRSDMFSTSTSAYNDINATLGSFYERPREDPEKEALKAELEQMKQSTVIAQNLQPTYEEQIALLEKSYELAAKYMPGNSVTTENEEDKDDNTEQNNKPKAVHIGLVSRPVVSSLPQPMNDSVMINRLMRYDRYGFHTAVGEAPKQTARNTIKACVYGDQTVVSGQSV